MRTGARLLAVLCASTAIAATAADSRGVTEIGVGYVSDDSARFGEYTGLDDKGLFAVGNLALGLQGDAGRWWHLEATDLGLEARALGLAGGEPGRYSLRLGYDRIPSYALEATRTVFDGAGGSALTLPPGWIQAPATAGMTALPAALRDVDLGTDRDRFRFTLALGSRERLSYDLDYRYDRKRGTGLASASFLTLASELPSPVDYDTHGIDAGLRYAREGWGAQLGYHGSYFANGASALRFQNPFIAPAPGADQGEIAPKPDNEFHQLALGGHYRLPLQTQLSGNLMLGRMEQDEPLTAISLNPNVALAPARAEANARADTVHADLRLSSRPLPRLRLGSEYVYDERDNDTPIATWQYAVTDTTTPGERENLAYGYQRYRVGFSGEYRLRQPISTALGWGREVMERDFAEVDRAEEDEIWGRAQLRLGDRADVHLRYVVADRDVSDYRPVPETQPAQNPLLRKYNLADRDRDMIELALALYPDGPLDAGLTVRRSDDDYRSSPLGLQEATHTSVNADANLALPAGVVLTAAAGFEDIESRQAGSQTFSSSDWHAEQGDETRIASVALERPQWLGRIDLWLGYTYAATESGIVLRQSGSDSFFPDLDTRRHRFEAEARYRLRERLSLLLRYIREHYAVSDWSRDAVAADTLPRLLGLGGQWPDYDVGVVSVSVSMNFGSEAKDASR